MSMSCAMTSCTPGRCSLTATVSPVTRRALWTWATEAEPRGTSSIASKMSSMGRSYSARSVARTTSRSMGSTCVRSLESSRQKGSERISERIERIWPAFTKVGPSSSSICLKLTGVRPWRMSYLRTMETISAIRRIRLRLPRP